MDNLISSSLGIRFDISGAELDIYYPTGKYFATYIQIY